MKTKFFKLLPALTLLILQPTSTAQRAYQTSAGHYEYGGSPAFGGPSNSDGWAAYAAAEWVSRYMQRGYQQFGNAGAFAIMLGGGYGPIGADLEQRIADTDSDREFRGTLHATHQMHDLDFGVRATYMSTLRGQPSNWDLGLGVGGDLLWGIRWETEIYYGTEPKNFYGDAGLNREWEFGGAWSFKASAGLGVNLGYQRDAAKGFDHAAFGLDIARAFGPQSTIYGGVGHYAPINRDTTKYTDHRDLYDGFIFRFGARWDY
jgi:hypothetical protein